MPMTVRSVEHHLQLGQDRLIDMFLVQWNTPLLVRDHQWSKIEEGQAEERLNLLRSFRDWLLRHFVPSTPERAVFILMPELSVPIRCESVINEIVDSLQRPTVLIAGLEYLRWSEYTELWGRLPSMPTAPPAGVDNNRVVNSAGIWIREDAAAETKRYLQSKIHPQDHEQAIPVYSGSELLVFESLNQVPGSRLNFCVQICSDFTSPVFVRELRREMANECPDLVLDLTFLIQSNIDQTAIQFNEAVQMYFDVPDNMTETERGSLIFINNANPQTGKSSHWGRSKLNFPRGRWRNATFPAPTYWIKDYDAFNHQAVWLRESGPGVYWLTYKPHYLVPKVAGSGQLPPFPDAAARFAYQIGAEFGEGEDGSRFKPIPAICHWLDGEFGEGEAEWRTELEMLKDGVIDQRQRGEIDEVIGACLTSWNTRSQEFESYLDKRDELARDALSIYFGAWADRKDYPGQEPEPCEWSMECSIAIKHMMRVISLLSFGCRALPDSSLTVEVKGAHHMTASDQMRFAFMWGGNIKYPASMIAHYRKNLENYGIGDLAERKAILVLVGAVGTPSKSELLANRERITKPNDSGSLKSAGDVVKTVEPSLILLYNSELESGISLATGQVDLEQRIFDVLQRELA
jgi:hypothetical protein